MEFRRWIEFGTENHNWPQIYVIFVASLSGLTSMALLTWPSPSIPVLTSTASHMDIINPEEGSYFAVIPPIATILASPLMSVLVDIIGRKKMIILMIFPHIMSWTFVVISQNLMYLYVSRVLYGIADAIMYCTLPTFIGEISTPAVRGTWGNTVMIFMFSGQFLINAIGAYCSVKRTALIFLIVPIVQFVFVSVLPESPYFLLMKKRNSEAENSLRWLRWNRNVQKEFNLLSKDVQRQISEPGTLKDLFSIRTNRKALFICVMIRIFQQFSGVAAFGVYTQQIFNIAGGNLSPSISAIIYTGVLVFMAFLYSFFVDKLGRRRLMLFSTIGASIALLIQTIYFYLQFESNLDLSGFTWVPLTSMIFYIVTCIGGIGVLPTLLLGELFSSSVKGKAMGVVNIFFSLCLIAVPKLFQLLTNTFSIYVPFMLYTICTMISIVFYYLFLPETRKMTLEQIQQILANKKVVKCDQESS
ncbi:hypothetical protein FQR65_LT09447 [Abscondita terminalis]|nr:hypothetical protein FQR65_LT09447 [Abscondita terminalis]